MSTSTVLLMWLACFAVTFISRFAICSGELTGCSTVLKLPTLLIYLALIAISLRLISSKRKEPSMTPHVAFISLSILGLIYILFKMG